MKFFSEISMVEQGRPKFSSDLSGGTGLVEIFSQISVVDGLVEIFLRDLDDGTGLVEIFLRSQWWTG